MHAEEHDLGGRIAVVGAGISGLSSALALVQLARLRGRTAEVHLFGGTSSHGVSSLGAGEPERPHAPVLLTPECRSRLLAQDCRVSAHWRRRLLTHLEIRAGSARVTLPLTQGAIWVVDEWPYGRSGQRVLREALEEAAARAGVHRQFVRVSSAEPHHDDPTLGWILGAAGRYDAFEALVLAPGVSQGSPGRILGDSGPSPTLPAACARLREVPSSWPGVLRIWLFPLPGLDALVLVPCLDSWYALAFGPTCEPADLCEAVMLAARDGLTPDGFELTALQTTRVPVGLGNLLADRSRRLVGSAALGHPFRLGIRDTLVMAHRAAVSLLGQTGGQLSAPGRYEREDLDDIASDARMGATTLRWLRRAGPEAHRAFRLARKPAPLDGTQPLFGPDTPSARALLQASRWAAFHGVFQRLWSGVSTPPRTERRRVEPRLIYVVDDDEDVRSALTRALEERGAEVIAFGDELALLCAASRRAPDAILLDVVLRRVDGLRLCHSLKTHPLTASSRILVMSGLDRPHVRRMAREAGADGFLPKPLDLERVWRRLHGHTPPLQNPRDIEGGAQTA